MKSKKNLTTYLLIDRQGAGKTLSVPLLKLHLDLAHVFDDEAKVYWPDLPDGSLVIRNGTLDAVPPHVKVISLADALRMVIEKLEGSKNPS